MRGVGFVASGGGGLALVRALGLALLLALAGLPASRALAQDDPLVQRGVPAEATAATAVLAREQALNSGQRLAYERMAGSLGLPASASTQQIEGMVRSLIIETEHISARSYSARITVNFNPQRVAAAGGRLPASPNAALPGDPSLANPDQPGPATATGPAVTTVEALASYRSFAEWIEISRRLGASAPVARVDLVSISGDSARLRLALRQMPQQAAADLAASGLALSPAFPDPRFAPAGGAARPGEGWRLSLAGGR